MRVIQYTDDNDKKIPNHYFIEDRKNRTGYLQVQTSRMSAPCILAKVVEGRKFIHMNALAPWYMDFKYTKQSLCTFLWMKDIEEIEMAIAKGQIIEVNLEEDL